MTWKRCVITFALLPYFGSLLTLAVPFGIRDGLFLSPDEHATSMFAREIAVSGLPRIAFPEHEGISDLAHPRSTLVLGSFIVPASFLGMSYLAGGAYILAPQLLYVVVPMVSIVGLCALFGTLRRLGASHEYAAFATVLVALHPAWWYYSMRTLMPNIPFVSLFMVALWMALVAQSRLSVYLGKVFALGSGMVFACALAIRPSEAIWIALFLVAVWFLRKTLDIAQLFTWRFGVWFASGCAVVVAAFFFVHRAVYGRVLATGYTLVESSIGDAHAMTVVERVVQWLTQMFHIVFPFGVHEYATLRHLWEYVVVLYPWMAIPGVVGIGFFVYTHFIRRDRVSPLSYLGIGVLCLSAGYLALLYGSWTFFDNPNVTLVTLGNSYVRYWLPFALAVSLFGAYGLLRMRDVVCVKYRFGRVIPVIGVMVVALCSVHLVFWGHDGVLPSRAALATFVEKRDAILAHTPQDAVIVVDRADKYVWPDRQVIVPLRSDATYRAIAELVPHAPLYYFGITLPEADRMYLQDVVFRDVGITFSPIVTIDEETLYRIHSSLISPAEFVIPGLTRNSMLDACLPAGRPDPLGGLGAMRCPV